MFLYLSSSIASLAKRLRLLAQPLSFRFDLCPLKSLDVSYVCTSCYPFRIIDLFDQLLLFLLVLKHHLAGGIAKVKFFYADLITQSFLSCPSHHFDARVEIMDSPYAISASMLKIIGLRKFIHFVLHVGVSEAIV